jgi:uncharacterized membrane protein YtjA (UPF0391 family)
LEDLIPPRRVIKNGTKSENLSYELPTLRDAVMTLLKWALIFFLISVVAAVFGFTDISAASADVARVLFYIFLVIFLLLVVLGLWAFRR